jgi:hypothetical protein
MGASIIVLGMHRGGTSLLANLVSVCGAHAGDERLLLKADESNARGYWEYMPLIEFNDELLNSVCAKTLIPPSDEAYKELERQSSVPKYRDRALRLLRVMQESGLTWFWKDPRLGVLLPFWKRIWGDVIYVISIRHPLDIALSIQKRDAYPISASLLIWQRYMSAILEGTKTAQNALFIEYEEVIENPFQQCERLYLFLCRHFQTQVGKEQIVKNMMQAIAPELRHNRSSLSLSKAPQATEGQQTLYDILKRKTENLAEHIDQTRISIYPGWREYLLITDAMFQLWFTLPKSERHEALSRLPATHKELSEMFGL